uniref:Uncharacterized protein n=1 Tax=Oryza barthii TaxID=65489 RepID=A0A0D3FW28_9ORYZ
MGVFSSSPHPTSFAFPSEPPPHDATRPLAEGRASRRFLAERRSRETHWGATGSYGHRFPSSYSYSTLGRRKGMRTTRCRGKAFACTRGRAGVAAGRIAALHADHIQANPDREGRKKNKRIQIGEEEDQANPGRRQGPPPPAIRCRPPMSCSPCGGREAGTGGGIAVPCSPLAACRQCRRFDASGRVGRGRLPASGMREEAEETRRRERREESGGREEEGGGGGKRGRERREVAVAGWEAATARWVTRARRRSEKKRRKKREGRSGGRKEGF